jgi:hypothetical protein
MGEQFEVDDRVQLVQLSQRNPLYGCNVAVGTQGLVKQAPDSDDDVLVAFEGHEYALWCYAGDLRAAAEPQADEVLYATPTPAAPAPARLIIAAAQLGPRAMVVLAAVAERLAKGAVEHGDFAPGSCPNPDRETAEELLDGIVYQTVKALRAAGEL